MALAVDKKVTVFQRVADYNKSAHIYLVDEVVSSTSYVTVCVNMCIFIFSPKFSLTVIHD